MIAKLKSNWHLSIVFLFILLNAFFVANEWYAFIVLPIAIILSVLYFRAIDVIVLLCVFCTPFSVDLELKDFGLSLSIPTEPLMIVALVVYGLKIIIDGGLPSQILKHPISLAIFFNLGWVFITSLTSTMPMVSFKFLLARLWFVVPFYFLGIAIFKDFKNIPKYIWLYIVPMAGVAVYTMVMHSQNSFTEESAHWVMDPFFNDHTSYGAMLAYFFPVLIVFSLSKYPSPTTRAFGIFFLLLFTVAIILSYTRAAWVSLVVAFVLYLFMLGKLKFKTLMMVAGLVVVVFIINMEKLLMKLEKNQQDSSSNLTEHVQSISNISSDASNLERLNRWSSAIRMFRDKPYFGFGPGTYMFMYAPYQKSNEKTIISTNAGDAGNAHSEYIGPLAESGILGMISIFVIIIAFTSTAFKLYFNLKDNRVKVLVMSIFLGLITYFVHGALNNFLDTDKAAVPVFGFMAMLTAIDLYHSGKEKEVEVEQEN